MDLRLRTLGGLDPRTVPLPNGTEVTVRVERTHGERRIPQGAVGRVVDRIGDEYHVQLVGVLARAEALVPELEEARQTTRLPLTGDVARADGVLREIRREAARRHFAAGPGPFGADAPSPPATVLAGDDE